MVIFAVIIMVIAILVLSGAGTIIFMDVIKNKKKMKE